MFQKNQVFTEGTGFSGGGHPGTDLMKIGAADRTAQQQLTCCKRPPAKREINMSEQSWMFTCSISWMKIELSFEKTTPIFAKHRISTTCAI